MVTDPRCPTSRRMQAARRAGARPTSESRVASRRDSTEVVSHLIANHAAIRPKSDRTRSAGSPPADRSRRAYEPVDTPDPLARRSEPRALHRVPPTIASDGSRPRRRPSSERPKPPPDSGHVVLVLRHSCHRAGHRVETVEHNRRAPPKQLLRLGRPPHFCSVRPVSDHDSHSFRCEPCKHDSVVHRTTRRWATTLRSPGPAPRAEARVTAVRVITEAITRALRTIASLA